MLCKKKLSTVCTSDEDRAAVIEEFFPEVSGESDTGADSTLTVSGQKPGLAAKLNSKAEKLRGSGA